MNQNLIKEAYHISLAENIQRDVFYGRDKYYYFVGKSTPFPNAEDDPPTLTQSSADEKLIRDDIFAMKRVLPSDVSLVIRKITWQSGLVFDMYDSSVDLKDLDFYVITDSNRVYKCLDNNNGAVSTVKPTTNSVNPEYTSDGYVWKYMYTVPLSLKNKFESINYIPVTRSLTNQFYSSGEITEVTVKNSGTGYSDSTTITASVVGDGVNAQVLPVVNPTDGSIIAIKVINPGLAYTTATIIINDPLNTPSEQAVFRTYIVDGELRAVFVAEPGLGYSVNGTNSITVEGDGVGAVLVPVIFGGEVIDVVVKDSGTGYTFANLTINGLGVDAEAEVTLFLGNLEAEQSVIEQTAISGGVHSIVVTSPGSGYTTASVQLIGDGALLEAEAVITNGQISKINVINPGQGYTDLVVNIVGDGVGATARAIYSPPGGHGRDAPKELLASTVCFYNSFRSESYFSVDVESEFRYYGLIKNPDRFDSQTGLSNLFAPCVSKLTLNDYTGITKNSLINISNSDFIVLDVGINYVLVYGNKSSQITINDSFILSGESESRTITNVVNSPVANKYSGEMVYVKALGGISFSPEQITTLQTYINL